MRQPIRCGRSGLWLARYQDADGKLRQAGRFVRKRDAAMAIAAATERVEAVRAGEEEPSEAPVTVLEFLATWPERFPRHPRTADSNVKRITKYVLPHLPRKGDIPLTELRRAMMRDVMAALLKRRLGKATIDGVFSAFSAMLSDAVDDELIDVNPARGFRVKPSDPRLQPKKPARDRRAIPPAEVGAFMTALPRQWWPVCWAPFLTGARPGELFAMRRGEIDRDRGLIYLHETVDRYGRLEAGTKTTHHIREKERRGRWTLCPPSLISMFDELPSDDEDLMFLSPRGHTVSHRNFYRGVWQSAQKAPGTSFTLYDARHTFSSRLLAAGIPVVEVAAWMGHSLRAGGAEVNTTTRMYAHATGEHRAAALAELERFFAMATGAHEAGRAPGVARA
jgi:integrase